MTDRTITPEIVRLIRGMLRRGDKNQDIAACFSINQGRISEIKTGQTYTDVLGEATPDELPPPPPYPSPFELLQAQQGLWAARVALQAVSERVEQALVAVTN